MFSKNDIDEIRNIRNRSTISLSSAARKLAVEKHCREISSGTLATLTGRKFYEELEAVRADFTTYVHVSIPKKNWDTWMDAWNEFKEKFPAVDKTETT